MKKIIFTIVIVFSILFTLPSLATEGSTKWRNITGFGCHLTDGTCYFEIDGNPVGSTACLGNGVRFNVLESPNGKTWLSLLQTAYVTNKRININIVGCYGNYPTFNYGRIEK